MTTSSAFWDRAAPKYSKSPIKNMQAYEETLERTRSYLRDTDTVLELGCGTGSTALLLADSVDQYVGSDFSKGMIEIANAKLDESAPRNITFCAVDVFDPTFQTGAYDVITGFNLFHLVENLDGTLERANELLKPGGLLISKTPCLSDFPWIVRPLISVLRFFGKAPHVRFFNIREWEAQIEKAGFEIVETGLYPAKPPSRFVVAKKS